MHEKIREEYEKSLAKRDEIRQELKDLEKQSPQDSYTITITRDRLAYWEGRAEGLKFALDIISGSGGRASQYAKKKE